MILSFARDLPADEKKTAQQERKTVFSSRFQCAGKCKLDEGFTRSGPDSAAAIYAEHRKQHQYDCTVCVRDGKPYANKDCPYERDIRKATAAHRCSVMLYVCREPDQLPFVQSQTGYTVFRLKFMPTI